jgi:hypothetical protein
MNLKKIQKKSKKNGWVGRPGRELSFQCLRPTALQCNSHSLIEKGYCIIINSVCQWLSRMMFTNPTAASTAK